MIDTPAEKAHRAKHKIHRSLWLAYKKERRRLEGGITQARCRKSQQQAIIDNMVPRLAELLESFKIHEIEDIK